MEIDESNEESQAADSQTNIEEDVLVPKIITEEFFDNLCIKTNTIIKDLQADQQYILAEDVQRILGVSQNFKRSLDNEKTKNDEMKENVAAATGRIAEAVKISQIDHETIERLKTEIENAWKQTDAAQTRDTDTQEAMLVLREKLEKLQKETEKLERKDGNEELGVNLSKHKEGLLRERDRLAAEVEELNKRLQIQRLYSDEMEKKRLESETKAKELYKLLDETSSEAFKDKRALDAIKIQLKDMTHEKIQKEEEANHYKWQAEVHHKTTIQQNLQLIAAKSSFERLTTQHSIATAKIIKFTTELESLIQLKEKLTYELSQKSNLLKLREDENSKHRLETTKLIKSREMLMKKLMNVESAKGILNQEVLKLSNAIVTFEKERDATKKAFDIAKKDMDKVLRDRDLVRKDLMKANRVINDHVDTIILYEQHIKTMENEIKSHIAAAQKQKAVMTQIEKERDRNAEESQMLADKVESINEDLTLKINYIAELKEKIADLNVKLTHFKQLFETNRSERNAFERDLQACVEDREDIKERLRVATRQVEQLKEDVSVKDNKLLEADKKIDVLEKEKQTLKIEVQNTLVILQHTKSELKEKKVENERLYKTLSEDETRLMKQRKELDNVMNEKDLIGTQMIRRNDEIGLLNEKLHIIQMALDRGESQYNKRLDDIRLLKIEIGNLRSQRNLLTRGLANTSDMRQEVLQLHRVLTQERVKAKALEQEMTTPMNIHRWRKLEGKDPDKLDLVVKIQTLQKRILYQTVVATEREQTLQDTQKLYISLKEFILKLPSSHVKERLNSTQRALTARTKKMKALAAQLYANEIDTKRQECVVEELKSSLVETKKELIKQKKEKTKLIDEQNANNKNPPTPTPTNKTMGGGFKIIC